MGLLILIGCLVLVIIAIVLFIKVHERKITLDQIEQKKKKLQQDVDALVCQLQDQTKDLKSVKDSIKSSKNQIDYINKIINEKQQEHKKILKDIEESKKTCNNFYNQQKQIIEKQLDDFKIVYSKAAESYVDNL